MVLPYFSMLAFRLRQHRKIFAVQLFYEKSDQNDSKLPMFLNELHIYQMIPIFHILLTGN